MDISSLKGIICVITTGIVLVLVISLLRILFKRKYRESYMNGKRRVKFVCSTKVNKENEQPETFKMGEEFEKPIILGDAVKMFTRNYMKDIRPSKDF
jgi:hypothetical protein